jgi:hypothetical protein
MTATIKEALAGVDRDAIQREADELRTQLKNYEDLLALIDRIGIGGPGAIVTMQPEAEVTTTTNGHGGNGHKRLSEKRDLVLAIIGERPGRWTPAEVRDALRARDVDPEAGTPVKNILWQLAKAGTLHAAGGGVYEFPALTVSVDIDPHREVLAA